MLFRTLLRDRKRPFRHRPRRPARSRLLLEWLEPRNLLSVVNVNTDTDLTAPHNETTIAVNPTNPLNLIGSANDYQAVFNSSGGVVSVTVYSRAHVTFDGGQTWTNFTVPFNTSLYKVTGDAAVAFDADGTAYLATLGEADFGAIGDVQVAHSTNGGQTWSVPVRVAAGSGTLGGKAINNDKDYIAAWGHGNAIVTWTEVNTNGDGTFVSLTILASVTHDGGNTWTLPVQISGNLTSDQASVPVVAADGSIYVAFLSGESLGDNSHDNYMVVKVSPTDAKVLKDPVKVSDLVDSREDYPVNVNNRSTYQDSEFRTWAAGNIAADPTNARHLAVVWSDMHNSTLLPPTNPYLAKTNSDIVVSQSFDGGNTWSAPTALAIPNDQFMPWGAYNAHGQLQIGFFDRSYDPANHKYGYTLASETTPGSLHFTLQEVTTALSDPTQGDAFFFTTVNSNFPKATRFIGDYSNIAITPNGVAAFWTDMRLQSTAPPPFTGSTEDAFFALVDPPPPPAAIVSQPAPAGAVLAASATCPPPGSSRLAASDTSVATSGSLAENSAAALSGMAAPAAISVDAMFAGTLAQPVSASANSVWSQDAQASFSAVESAIWQWVMNQPTVASSAPVTDSPTIPGASATDSQPDSSLWSDPFAPTILGL